MAADEYLELAMTAIHEAGHAVCDVLHGIKVWKVTIQPNGECLNSRFGFRLIRRKYFRAEVRSCCAGYIAESLFYPEDSEIEGAEDDFKQAERLLRQFHPDQDITNEFCAVYEETADLLSRADVKTAIWFVAATLLKHTTITGKRVMTIVSACVGSTHALQPQLTTKEIRI